MLLTSQTPDPEKQPPVMSKTLLLVRHAKSSWDDPFLRDHERPLLNTGINRTAKVSKFLQAKKVHPDLIISSHAVRALETAKLLADGLNYPFHKILIESNIYYRDEEGLFEIALALPDQSEVVMMVGHNPAMTQFANMFLDTKLDYLPTTGVVCVNFNVDEWNKMPQADARLDFYITPKLLK